MHVNAMNPCYNPIYISMIFPLFSHAYSKNIPVIIYISMILFKQKKPVLLPCSHHFPNMSPIMCHGLSYDFPRIVRFPTIFPGQKNRCPSIFPAFSQHCRNKQPFPAEVSLQRGALGRGSTDRGTLGLEGPAAGDDGEDVMEKTDDVKKMVY